MLGSFSCSAQPSERDLLIPPGIDTVWHGAYLPTGETIPASAIATYESQAGKKIAAAITYVGWYPGAWTTVQADWSSKRAFSTDELRRCPPRTER